MSPSLPLPWLEEKSKEGCVFLWKQENKTKIYSKGIFRVDTEPGFLAQVLLSYRNSFMPHCFHETFPTTIQASSNTHLELHSPAMLGFSPIHFIHAFFISPSSLQPQTPESAKHLTQTLQVCVLDQKRGNGGKVMTWGDNGSILSSFPLERASRM